jgi:predicted amidohydrolase YtcJ
MTSSDAELLFTNGRVFTGPSGRGYATTVAVRAGRVVAVGHDELLSLRGAATEVVDLAGGLLLPGFQDAHVHPVQAGVELLSCDLTATSTARECLELVGQYARSRPELEWITGGGWSMSAFEGGVPRAADLDDAVADRPVFLVNRDHHSGWANSLALRLAGVDRTTPDPPDGRIERGADGTPTGTLHEGAMALVNRVVPEVTDDQLLAGLLAAQQQLHSWGITAWQDAIVGDYANLRDPSGAYRRAEEDGRLTAKVVGALWWDRAAGAEQIPRLIERRAELHGPRFRATSVKMMLDGVVETRTAAMLEPYLDGHGCATGHRGTSFIDPAALPDYVTALDAEGFQVHVHAIGDAAVRDALDAFAAARRANGPGDNRHHMAHIEVVDPADLPRFRALGVAANMQPLWAAYEPQMTELAIPVLGQRRSDLQYPFGDLARSGAALAGGSDWPVTTADPLQGVHVAVNRRLPGSDEPVFLPEQRLDLTTALAAYTSGSAYVNHLDDTGTIAPGQSADLVVLDRDPFAAPPAEIADARVLRTFVDGRCVYSA